MGFGSRTISRAGMYRGALIIWSFLFIAGTSADSTSVTIAQVQAACSVCDVNFGSAYTAFRINFGVSLYKTAVDGAKHHCSVMANISKCYTDCQAGSIYMYASGNKKLFDLFYRDFCDPACYVAILPYCYYTTVGAYDQGLTCVGSQMETNLRSCLATELFTNQNCTPGCTPGQRKALFLFMQLQIPCRVSYITQGDCYNAVQYCTDHVFGNSGSDYSGLTDPALLQNNSVGCKEFGDGYIDCLEAALSGTLKLGVAAYVTTYQQPCKNLTTTIRTLEDYGQRYLAVPFCRAPTKKLSDSCGFAPAASASPQITMTTVTPAGIYTSSAAGVKPAATSANSGTLSNRPTAPQASTSVSSSAAAGTEVASSTTDALNLDDWFANETTTDSGSRGVPSIMFLYWHLALVMMFAVNIL